MPVRGGLSQLDPDLYSLASGTNSTMSRALGPGRVMDRLIASGGRRIDTALTTAGELLGLGQNALVARFLCSKDVDYARCDDCSESRRVLSRIVRPSFADVRPCMLRWVCSECESAFRHCVIGPSGDKEEAASSRGRRAFTDVCSKLVRTLG
jgi:hypothetical protein